MSIFLLILSLILFVGLVVVHEWGHMIAARRGGVEVEEFGIGFPPTAWSKKLKSKMLLSINWVPLGGFVKLKGEHDADTAPHSYGAASLSTKVKIMVAGVGMNLVVAFIMFTLIALIGMPKLFADQFTVASDTKITRQEVLIGYIEAGSPAQKSGLNERDRIERITSNGQTYEVNSTEDLPKITKSIAGQQATVYYIRGGNEASTQVDIRSSEEVEASKNDPEPKGYLGIVPTEYSLRRSTWSAPIVAGGLIKQLTELTFKGLGTAIGSLFQGDTAKASAQVSGPVGIFVILKDGSLLGVQFVLMIIAIISLTLAIMNALPIPALDGGRLFVTLLFRAIRKPLKPKTEELIHGTGFVMLIILFLLITVVDVKRFF